MQQSGFVLLYVLIFLVNIGLLLMDMEHTVLSMKTYLYSMDEISLQV